jgi:putative MATE family efflux protein
MTPAIPHGRVAGGYREVVSLAFPLVLSMLSQTVMTAVEAAFLGRYGTVEQGAAGLAGALLWPLRLLCNWSGIGVQICVAQSIGAQRRADCGALTWQGIYVSVLAWLFLIAAGLGAPHIVQLSAPSPELVVPTVLYLRIELLGSLPGLLNLALVGFFRGLGDTKTPLMVTLVVELLSTLLDVLLIFGTAGFPRLGIAGAALSTVSSTAVGTVIYFCLFLRRGQREGLLTQSRLPFDRHACWRLVRLSWPIGAHGTLEVGAWTLFTALAAHLGTIEAAAHTIAIRVISLAYMAGYGISVAATTLVGQDLGAQEPAAARRSMRSCLVLALLLMGSMGVGFFVWRQPLVGLFTRDHAVAQLAVQLLIFVALFQIFDSLSLIAMGVLRGAGQTRWPMLVGLLINWGLFVPSAALAMFTWQGGLLGGWAVALGSAILLGLVLLWRALRGGWSSHLCT